MAEGKHLTSELRIGADPVDSPPPSAGETAASRARVYTKVPLWGGQPN
jgi:hypothetical protein